MKKTLVSLATASLIASTAMAADKGIDIVTTGQAVLYYETQDDNGKNTVGGVKKDRSSMFDERSSQANVGVQLNLDADLKNNFTFGSQLSYLGTAGLEKNVVSGVKQDAGLSTSVWTTDQLALTKIFVAKKIANTTVKIGRQELPKSLSPFAYSEGWNVFKNTFDAVLAVNTDIPDTTLVGAYVSGGTGMGIQSTSDLTSKVGVPIGVPGVPAGDLTADVDGTAYMLTVQNKSIPMTTLTLSYYDLARVGNRLTANDETIAANVIWADAMVAGKDLPMGIRFGLQGGQISTDSTLKNVVGVGDVDMENTTAFGVKVGAKPIDALTLCAAYTSVSGDDDKVNVAVKNVGTGIKSPLYTQMIYNQDAISLDANTFMLKAAYNTGDYGTVIAQGAMTSAGKSNLMNENRNKETDYNEFDLIYKVKAAGVQYFAAYIYRSWSEKTVAGSTLEGHDSDNRLRVWARYNF